MFVIVEHGLEYPNRRKKVWNVSEAAAENKSMIISFMIFHIQM